MMGKKIVPKKLTRGVDFCGVADYFYIIRSDLTCYMKSTNFTTGADLEVFSLHPYCRGGDHYLAHRDGFFYIIKGNCYRCVKNINTDANPVIYALHRNCQGGDHYMSAYNYFYIIYQRRGVYRRTKNISSDEGGEEFTLHPSCKSGIYFFGTSNFCYFVKPHDLLGVEYIQRNNFNDLMNSETFSFNPSVTNFLPGGLGFTIGPTCTEWVCVKKMCSNSEVPSMLSSTIKRKIGYEKDKMMSSIENNWRVSSLVTAETGGLAARIIQSQFMLPAEYGGTSINTEKDSWTEVTEVEEPVTVSLQPHQEICVWTFQLSLGKQPVLYCRDLRSLDTCILPIMMAHSPC